MRRLMLLLFVGAIAAPVSGHAQVTLDMTRITCADYLAMPPSQSATFAAWMSGWFNYKFGYVSVGLDDFARNVASVKQWCTSSPGATVMAALDRSVPQPVAGGQIKVDMSLITCKQYLSSDADRKNMIAAWMSGYFRASRAQPVLDFQRFASNRTAVSRYCSKRGGETLMSAIQKSAR